MKTFIFILQFLSFAVYAQKVDTISVNPENLRLNSINYGNHTFIVYNKKKKDGPSERMTLVKIKVEANKKDGKNITTITQQWERDTVIHTAVTEFDSKTFSTLNHTTFWKPLKYTARYNFESKRVSFDGKLADSLKTKAINDFNDSFSKYNLNWHSDLLIFPLLPFKENRVFKINFYDPGFGKAQEVFYRVEGSEKLSTASGKIDCWILVIRYTKPSVSTQKFWIAKKSNEVLKEEDEFNGQYRYKLKVAVSEND